MGRTRRRCRLATASGQPGPACLPAVQRRGTRAAVLLHARASGPEVGPEVTTKSQRAVACSLSKTWPLPLGFPAGEAFLCSAPRLSSPAEPDPPLCSSAPWQSLCRGWAAAEGTGAWREGSDPGTAAVGSGQGSSSAPASNAAQDSP